MPTTTKLKQSPTTSLLYQSNHKETKHLKSQKVIKAFVLTHGIGRRENQLQRLGFPRLVRLPAVPKEPDKGEALVNCEYNNCEKFP